MILVYGSINLDLIYRLDAMPTPGQTVSAHGMTTEPGGKGANQAVAAARDGAAVAMVGTVGDDALADVALAGLCAAGVDMTGLAVVSGATGSAFICIDANGQNQIVVAAGANAATRAAQIEDASLTPGATLVTQMETDPHETAALIGRARARGVRCIHNLAPATALALDALRLLDVLVVNEEEGRWLGEHLDSGAEGDALALHGILGVTVIRTLGGDGVEWAQGGRRRHLPAPRIAVADTTAAGDCFVGVLAAALDRGMTLDDAIRRAGAAASLACTRPGSQRSLPDAAAIDTAFAEHG
jgi:ribokinase